MHFGWRCGECDGTFWGIGALASYDAQLCAACAVAAWRRDYDWTLRCLCRNPASYPPFSFQSYTIQIVDLVEEFCVGSAVWATFVHRRGLMWVFLLGPTFGGSVFRTLSGAAAASADAVAHQYRETIWEYLLRFLCAPERGARP